MASSSGPHTYLVTMASCGGRAGVTAALVPGLAAGAHVCASGAWRLWCGPPAASWFRLSSHVIPWKWTLWLCNVDSARLCIRMRRVLTFEQQALVRVPFVLPRCAGMTRQAVCSRSAERRRLCEQERLSLHCHLALEKVPDLPVLLVVRHKTWRRRACLDEFTAGELRGECCRRLAPVL